MPWYTYVAFLVLAVIGYYVIVEKIGRASCRERV